MRSLVWSKRDSRMGRMQVKLFKPLMAIRRVHVDTKLVNLGQILQKRKKLRTLRSKWPFACSSSMRESYGSGTHFQRDWRDMGSNWKLRLGARLVLLACLLGGSVAAYAGSNVNIQLTGAGGAEYGLGSNYAFGEYLMPYYLTINQSNPIAVVCDDFAHQVSVGDQWTATVSTFADLSHTRFGMADATQYHEAVWLASQITASSSLTDIAGVQFAIWKLLTPGTPDVGTEDFWMAKAQTAAVQNYGGMSFANWEILTPNNPLSPQEYFFQIPEPSILLELGMGLVTFVGLWNVRGRLQAASKL
jgi:hypothetical protein